MLQIAKDLDRVLSEFVFGNHIGLATFQREPKKWRSIFDKLGAIEVLDRNETYGLMLKPEIFDLMRDYIHALEEQLEEAQLDLLFARRGENMKWVSGEELQKSALESFDNRIDAIRGLLDGQQ